MAAALKCVLIGLLVASTLSLQAGGTMFGPSASLDFKTEKFDTCPQYPGVQNTIENLTIWNPPKEDSLFISGTMVIGFPLDDTPDYKYEMNVKRCLSQDWNRCEKFVEFELDHICRHLPQQNKLWSDFVEKMEDFDPHCPIKPGTYSFEDAPMDISEFNKLEAAVGYWEMELKTSFKGEVIFCVIGNAVISLKPRATG